MFEFKARYTFVVGPFACFWVLHSRQDFFRSSLFFSDIRLFLFFLHYTSMFIICIHIHTYIQHVSYFDNTLILVYIPSSSASTLTIHVSPPLSSSPSSSSLSAKNSLSGFLSCSYLLSYITALDSRTFTESESESLILPFLPHHIHARYPDSSLLCHVVYRCIGC